jgi:hypothetical protein
LQQDSVVGFCGHLAAGTTISLSVSVNGKASARPSTCLKRDGSARWQPGVWEEYISVCLLYLSAQGFTRTLLEK